jgi:hypothetical protein
MNRALGIAALITMTGCDVIDDVRDIRDQIDGYTERFVAQGIVLGVSPLDADIDLGGAGFHGAKAVMFLADATQIAELERAPISGAVPQLHSAINGSLPLYDDGNGAYSLHHDEGLRYQPGEMVAVSIGYDGEARALAVRAPSPADLQEVESIHRAETAMVIDLSDQPFHTALVVVFEVESGEVTYSNEPDGIQALYEMTHGSGLQGSEPEGVIVQIPEQAFKGEGVYAIGVAGITVGDEKHMDGVNIALSTMLAGTWRFAKVCTETYALACEP